MAKLYTPEEIEALILAERKATLEAIGRIPYGDIATTCFRWYYNTREAPPPLQKYIDDTKAAELADKEERGMNWTSLGRATERVFPAGKYYIGDPCFVLDDEHYNSTVCDGEEGFHTNATHTIGYFSTAYGDGCYRGTNGQSYGVDAGIIGIVPAELIKPDKATAEWGVLTFENEFVFGCTSDATFYVKDAVNPKNSFEIPTKDDGEDEEDEEEDE
jgi:hypothetical protein